MKVLITGAGGFVGLHLADHFSKDNDIAALGHRDLDITDRDRVFEELEARHPDVIINCAVVGVDECESDPEKARAVNIAGPRNLAEATSEVGAAMVHLSTNYVFDGKRDFGFYSIDDKAKPVNAYGRTKLKGEQAVLEACGQSYIVRTSWVFGGSTRCFFDRAIEALLRGEPIEAVMDSWASTTLVDDLVNRVDQIVRAGRYGIYH